MPAAHNNARSKFDAPAVVLCGLAAIILVYALSLFVEGGYGALARREEQVKIFATGPSEALSAHRAEQQTLLDEPARALDEAAGVYCMPIDDAMDRLASREAQ